MGEFVIVKAEYQAFLAFPNVGGKLYLFVLGNSLKLAVSDSASILFLELLLSKCGRIKYSS